MNRLLLALLLFASAALMAQDTTSCASLEGLQYDLDGDMIVGVGDILEVLSWFGANFDLDQDDVLDCDDDCVGAYDECGICNGPGPQVLAIDTVIVIYDSVYAAAIDEWLIFELDRDTLLHLVCENPGCTDSVADNYDPYAEEGGLCTYGGPCQGPTFDGYSYSTVQIGDQCWFAENLRTTTYLNGDVIPAGLTSGEWNSTTSGATAVYGEGSSNCPNDFPDACDETQSLAEYGRLYNWYAVDDARGLCPTGWHVPTDLEWTDLESYITSQGFSGNEGTALKSTYGWLSISELDIDGNGTDDFGFSARSGGLRYLFGSFDYAVGNGFWWSSSPSGGSAWYRNLSFIDSVIYRDDGRSTVHGFSVRCLRDAN